MSDSAQSPEYDVLAAGIDWLTCTAKNGSASLALETVAMDHIKEQHREGIKAHPQIWQGFEGVKLEGLFFGRREHDVLLCLSGNLSNQIGLEAIQASTNVSRIDFAVTVVTNGEQVNLASDNWTRYKSLPKQSGRPREYGLIQNSTGGETFYLNSRRSDNFGRLYDKGIESHLAPAGMVWRFEVELKRLLAKLQAARLPSREKLAAHVSDLVRSWWSVRGVRPPWAIIDPEACFDSVAAAGRDDVLTWYDKSLSVSIARSIKQFGLAAVIEALHLQKHVRPLGSKNDGDI